jgi:Putative adhesin
MVSSYCAAKFSVFLIAACVTAVAENKLEQFSYTAGPKPIISITNQYGQIRLTPSSNNRVVATVLHSDIVEVQQQQSRNRIVLGSRLRNPTRHETARADYLVQVPNDAFVTLYSSVGSLSAQNLDADLVFEGSTASVEVHRISNAHIHIKTLNGPISLSNVLDSHVEVATISGNVNLQDVSRSFVSVRSGTGKIKYNGEPGLGVYALISHSGDIEVSMPTRASVQVRAKSLKGRIDNGFPVQPKASISSPPGREKSFLGGPASAASLTVRSFSGNIRLRSH